jgi:transmembrane sensor
MTDVPDDAEDPVWGQAMDWLLAVQAAPADAEIRRGLATWRAADAAHERAYRRAERVWRLTGALQPAAPALAPAAPVVTLSAHRPRRRVLAYGAAALVAACLLVLLMPPAMLRLQADYLTGAGERRQVTLADGTVVDLNADSAIAVDYAGDRRDLVLLAGEAFVTVGRDARPFRVRARDMTVVDIGTAFDVDLGTDAYSVAVEHGAVQVSYTGGQSPVDARLGPGDRLRDRRRGRDARPLSPRHDRPARRDAGRPAGHRRLRPGRSGRGTAHRDQTACGGGGRVHPLCLGGLAPLRLILKKIIRDP